MRNFENIIFLNKEIIVKELVSDNPLDNMDDSDDLEKLVECEIVKLGLGASPDFNIGDKIVVQRDALKEKRYEALTSEKYLVVFHENAIFCKINE